MSPRTVSEEAAATGVIKLSVGTSDTIGQAWWLRHEASGIQRMCTPVVDPTFRPVLLQMFFASGPKKESRRGLYAEMEFKAEMLPQLGFDGDQITSILKAATSGS